MSTFTDTASTMPPHRRVDMLLAHYGESHRDPRNEMTVATLGLVALMGYRVLPISVAIFVAVWIAQFVGHKLERRKPSFFDDLRYLWIGPLFVLVKLFRRFGLKW